MAKTDTRHGSTSLGIPGINGENGHRARLFFYGNDTLTSSLTNNIYFIVNGKTNYARRNGTEIPEPYDYIFYTSGTFDYIYVIKKVTGTSSFNCEVEEIDKIDLSHTESSFSGLTNFTLNIVSRAWTRSVRNMDIYNTFWSTGNDYYVYPTKSMQTTYNLLYDFSIAIPSTSNYTFTPDIKITIDFNSIQSFQMDSMLFDKFTSNPSEYNTYRGNIEKYAIKDYYGNTQIINFDDERLENFSITIKDYYDGIGSKYFTNSIPLMAEPLRRYKADPRAFICVYTKEDYFIKKSVIGELNLDFIINASPTSDTPSIAKLQIEETV